MNKPRVLDFPIQAFSHLCDHSLNFFSLQMLSSYLCAWVCQYQALLQVQSYEWRTVKSNSFLAPTTSNYALCSPWWSPLWLWPSPRQGCAADSQSTWFPSGLLSLFLQSFFQVLLGNLHFTAILKDIKTDFVFSSTKWKLTVICKKL